MASPPFVISILLLAASCFLAPPALAAQARLPAVRTGRAPPAAVPKRPGPAPAASADTGRKTAHSRSPVPLAAAEPYTQTEPASRHRAAHGRHLPSSQPLPSAKISAGSRVRTAGSSRLAPAAPAKIPPVKHRRLRKADKRQQRAPSQRRRAAGQRVTVGRHRRGVGQRSLRGAPLGR